MTYRAWNLKTLDRAAVRELTHAIAEQNTEELEYHSQSEEPWTEAQYNATLAAQQKENALLAGILAARGITDPTEALTLLAGEEELTDPMLLTDMDKACARILQAIDNEETIVVFGDYDVDGVTATALLLPAPERDGSQRQMYAAQPGGRWLRPLQKRHPVHPRQGLPAHRHGGQRHCRH